MDAKFVKNAQLKHPSDVHDNVMYTSFRQR